MRKLAFALSLLALTVSAGCAMNRGTSSMGASGTMSTASNERVLYCKDGMYATKATGCPAGLERELPAGSGYK